MGQTLQVPAAQRPSVTPSPTPTATLNRTTSPTPTPTPTLTVSSYAFIYVAQPGDTAASIARRFSLTVEDLMVANHLASPDRIARGDQLRIDPGAAQRASVASSPAPIASPTPTASVFGTLSPTRTATGSPTRTVTGGPSSVVNLAMQQRGAPYAFGGATPEGFDCSGYVHYVFRQAGQPISRDIFEQYASGTHPLRSELQPGDLVFFQDTYMDGLSHVGIFIGNGQFIHAADEVTGVGISDLNSEYWTAHWYGAARR